MIRYPTIIFVFLMCSIAHGADMYVSPSGAGSTCTEQSPCSANYAMAEAVAGDTWHFMDGVYDVVDDDGDYHTPSLSAVHSGTELMPITFKSLNRHGANIHGLGLLSTDIGVGLIGAYEKNYIILDGFTFSARDVSDTKDIYAQVLLRGCNGCKVLNCIFTGGEHSFGGAGNSSAITLNDTSDILIYGNVIDGYSEASNNENNGAFIIYTSQNLSIKNNIIKNCTQGIRLKQDADNATIENNFFYNNYISIYVSNDNAYQSTNPKITNNIIANSIYSGVVAEEKDGNNPDGVEVSGNTFFANGLQDLLIERTTETIAAKAKVFNNIFSHQLATIQTVAAGTLGESDHNLYPETFKISVPTVYTSLSTWQASTELYGGASPGTGSITGDPQFVPSAGDRDTIAEYALAVGSPCIAAGRIGANIGANAYTVGPLWMFARNRYRYGSSLVHHEETP